MKLNYLKKGLQLFLMCLAGFSVSYSQVLPANPNSNQKTKDLLNYFYSLSGKGVLSGQQMGPFIESITDYDNYFNSRSTLISGKFPAVFGSDFKDFRGQILVDNCRHYSALGSIITLSWHADCPAGGTAWAKISPDIIDGILTPGSNFNLVWRNELDTIYKYLNQLQDNGITVLWRPLHEMDGSWFWWGQRNRYKELWINMFNYFTNPEPGRIPLNNLIWVFSVSDRTSDVKELSSYYPGHNFVDILGIDDYHMQHMGFSDPIYHGMSESEYYQKVYNVMYDWEIYQKALLTLGNYKPIAYAECAKFPNVRNIPWGSSKFIYWLTWSGRHSPSGGNDDAWYQFVYPYTYVISQGNIRSNPNYIPTKPNYNEPWLKIQGSGSINGHSEQLLNPIGSNLSLYANPHSDSYFDKWTGTYSVANNPLNITMNNNLSIIANFKPNGSKLFSLMDNVTSLAKPLPPQNLVAATISTNQIKLSWIDNSSNESEFCIEKATASSGPFVQIGSVGPNVKSYSSSGLLNKTIYGFEFDLITKQGFLFIQILQLKKRFNYAIKERYPGSYPK